MSPDGFERFYVDAKDRCLRALLVTVRDPAEADDLLAEAFARALARWPRVRAHACPEAWIVRTALNLHRDRWRVTRRLVPGNAPRPSPRTFHSTVDPVLLAAVRALPQRQREVVALRVLLELSTAQTAEAVGISQGTVAAHLHRALHTLRSSLIESEVTP